LHINLARASEHLLKRSVGLPGISHLLGDPLSQLSKLFQNEVGLAKAELGDKVRQIGGAIGVSQSTSYLISAVVAAVLAGILFAVVMSRLDARSLAPSGSSQWF
jgi:hypothetical protein